MLFPLEFDGLYGYAHVTLTDMGNGTERVRLEHRLTSDQDLANAGKTTPKSYMPKRYAGVVIPTRIIEFVDVPKGRWVPDDAAIELVHRHVSENAAVEWVGRGWHIHHA